jgi:hypothetical protein
MGCSESSNSPPGERDADRFPSRFVEEQETLARLRQIHPGVDLADNWIQQFAQMLRSRTGEHLDAWLVQTKSRNLPELQSFACGREKDKAAVEEAEIHMGSKHGEVENGVARSGRAVPDGIARDDFMSKRGSRGDESAESLDDRSFLSGEAFKPGSNWFRWCVDVHAQNISHQARHRYALVKAPEQAAPSIVLDGRRPAMQMHLFS